MVLAGTGAGLWLRPRSRSPWSPYDAKTSSELGLDSVVLLERTAPGHFTRHCLESITCAHPSCDLGDFDGDGRVDLVTAIGFLGSDNTAGGERSRADSVDLWKNLEKQRADGDDASVRISVAKPP